MVRIPRGAESSHSLFAGESLHQNGFRSLDKLLYKISLCHVGINSGWAHAAAGPLARTHKSWLQLVH